MYLQRPLMLSFWGRKSWYMYKHLQKLAKDVCFGNALFMDEFNDMEKVWMENNEDAIGKHGLLELKDNNVKC